MARWIQTLNLSGEEIRDDGPDSGAVWVLVVVDIGLALLSALGSLLLER